jgi:membrane protein YdbS with pleckstrin-like domain
VLTGLPIGLLFALPIIFILFTGRYWFKRADMVANAELNPVLLVSAVLIIATFVAVLYKRHQWEMKEQQYKELKVKEKRKS